MWTPPDMCVVLPGHLVETVLDDVGACLKSQDVSEGFVGLLDWMSTCLSFLQVGPKCTHTFAVCACIHSLI